MKIKSMQKEQGVPLGIKLLFMVLLALVPLMAWIQFEWTGTVSQADERRMRDNLRTTAMRLAADLEQEISIPRELLMDSFPPGSTEESTPDPHDTLETLARLWAANSRSIAILPRLYLFSGDTGGHITTEQFFVFSSPDNTDWEAVPLPYPREDVLVMMDKASPPTTMTGDFRIIHRISTDPPLIVTLELDQTAIVSTLIPRLVDEYFGGTNGLKGYRVTIKTREGGTVFDSMPDSPPPAESKPDFTMPLLGRPETFFFQGIAERFQDNPRVRSWLERTRDRKPPAGLWNMELRHIDGSLEAAAQRVRWLNFGGGLAILAVLGAGIIYLFRLYNRNRLLVRSQKDFVSSVSHELRTPLTVLRAAAENMSEGLVREPDQAVRYGTHMLGEADRLLRLTENVLAWAGFEGGRVMPMESVDLSALVRERARWWKDSFDTARASLIVEMPPGQIAGDSSGSIMVRGNAESLASLVDNLLSNALRHGLPDEGPRSVTLALSTVRPGSCALEVRDHGQGISKKEQAMIFEAFYRAKGARGGGIGLGLSLVRRIVHAHQGILEVDSRPGSGTTFRVVLRSAAEPAGNGRGDDA